MEEREINIKNLFYSILSKWRSILIVSLIIACAFSAMKYYKDKKNYTDSLNIATNVDTEKISLTDEEQSIVNNVLDNQKELASYLDYQETSVLMNVDPYNEDKVALQYQIKAQDNLGIESIKAYVQSNGLAQDVKAICNNGLDEKSIAELISFATLEIKMQDNAIEVTENYDCNRIFTIEIIGKDANEATELADAVEEALQTYITNRESIFANVVVELVDRRQGVTIDTQIVNAQSELNSNIVNTQNRISTMWNTLSEEQIKAVKTENDTLLQDNASSSTIVAKPSLSIKNVIVGIIAGMLIMIMIYGFSYIMKDDIKYEEEIGELYKVDFLQRIEEKSNKNPVDGLISKLDVSKSAPLDQKLEQIIQLLLCQCSKNEWSSLMFLSSIALSENEQKRINQIKNSLKEHQINAVIVDNSLFNGEAMKQMKNCESVILVEKLQKTKYRDMNKEIALLRSINQNIGGYILL